MPSNAIASKPNKTTKSRFWSLFWPILFVAFGLLLAFVFGYIPATQVVGSEFNTATWTVRDFQYRREPFSKMQLTGVVRGKFSPIVASSGTFPNPYFKGRVAASSRWDLVEIQNGRTSTEGPAKILVTYLQARSLNSDFWPDWSTKNAVKASILWTAVRDLVDLKLYNNLPTLIELALVDCSDHQFQTSIQDTMITLIDRHCENLKSGGLTEQLQLAEKVGAAYRSATVFNEPAQ